MLKLVVGVVLLAVLIHLDPGGGFAGIGAITTLIKDCVQSKHEWCDDKFFYIPPKLAVAMAFDRLEPTTAPLALIFPITSNFSPGEVVPIPKLSVM